MKKYSYHRNRLNHRFSKLIKELRKFEWKYHNMILLLVSIIIAYYILKFKPALSLSFIYGLSYLGYFAAFIFGMLFTYALTAIPASAALYNLGSNFNPFLIAFIGAFGAVLSDYLIFRFVRDRLMDEIKLLSEEINRFTKPISDVMIKERIRIMIWRKISHSRIWKSLVPIVAGFIIASPLPDELGVAIFGAARYEPRKFLVYSYILNFVGILAIAFLANV